MSVNGISNSQSTAYSPVSNKTTKAADKTKNESVSSKEAGVVYEPSKATESAGSKVKDYSSIAKKMKGELNTKNQQLQNLVNQLLSKQANKYTKLSQLFEDVKNGKISVDPSTVAQAQKDIADDGYWGIEQTSDRLVSMAQALSGGDSAKADKMIAAIKKGFDQAAKAWGGKLPDICQKTIDSAVKKMEDWRDGLSTAKTEE